MKIEVGKVAMAAYYCVAMVASVHFANVAIQGEQGRFARIAILNEEEALRAELASLQTEVEAMENKVRRLSDNYLDLELLDERARLILGFVSENEVIIQ